MERIIQYSPPASLYKIESEGVQNDCKMTFPLSTGSEGGRGEYENDINNPINRNL